MIDVKHVTVQIIVLCHHNCDPGKLKKVVNYFKMVLFVIMNDKKFDDCLTRHAAYYFRTENVRN